MIVIALKIPGEAQAQLDAFTDNCEITWKNGFIRIGDEKNKMLAMYQPDNVIAIRRVPDPVQKQDNHGTETVHPSGGAEGQQDSPDRGSTG